MRTPGGPGATLASALREVLGVAPRVLELVLANPRTSYSNGSVSGNLGAAFQGGQWSTWLLAGQQPLHGQRSGRLVAVDARRNEDRRVNLEIRWSSGVDEALDGGTMTSTHSPWPRWRSGTWPT